MLVQAQRYTETGQNEACQCTSGYSTDCHTPDGRSKLKNTTDCDMLADGKLFF